MGMPTKILGVGPRRVKQATVTKSRHDGDPGGRSGPRDRAGRSAAGRSAEARLAGQPGTAVTTYYHPCCKRLSMTPKDVTTAAMYTRTIFVSPS
jgi:hypothetical protein